MNRRARPSSFLVLALLATLPAGCDYSGGETRAPREILAGQIPKSNINPSATGTARPGLPAPTNLAESADQKERQDAILGNVIRLVQSAATTPGGKHFETATKNLNEYFEGGTRPGDYLMSPSTRQFLLTMLPETLVKEFEATTFDPRFDGRHLEDCMLYNEIANRIAGEGDDLSRARRVFDWMVRQVQLVPAQSLAPTGMAQAQARPYDVLLRGMATESEGYWTERGWLFMVLCRQLGIDVGLVTYTPRQPSRLLAVQPAQPAEAPQPTAWICAALINDKAYLFDQRLGLAIPDAKGDGVATLEDAMTDPQILDRLNLPCHGRDYGTTRADLLASPDKIGILLDSSRGYVSPKMRLLQSRLTGKNRTILYRDPIDQREHFAKVLGPRLGSVKLWLLPLSVETFLFSNPQFVQATQVSIRLFDGRLPLLYARMAQLKGDLPEAIQQYVAFRYARGGTMRDAQKTPIVPVLQRELDHYATYFLALCNLEMGNTTQAEFFFKQTLQKTPEPAPNREYCYMFRWGAHTNLGLLSRAKGDIPAATMYLSRSDPTKQSDGNLWLARELVWSAPTSPLAAPLPAAPPVTTARPDAAALR